MGGERMNEPIVTHKGMEVEQELCNLNKAIDWLGEQIILSVETNKLLVKPVLDKEIMMFKFILPYLESHRDALISQQVIR
jgi:hypothetical protein